MAPPAIAVTLVALTLEARLATAAAVVLVLVVSVVVALAGWGRLLLRLATGDEGGQAIDAVLGAAVIVIVVIVVVVAVVLARVRLRLLLLWLIELRVARQIGLRIAGAELRLLARL